MWNALMIFLVFFKDVKQNSAKSKFLDKYFKVFSSDMF